MEQNLENTARQLIWTSGEYGFYLDAAQFPQAKGPLLRGAGDLGYDLYVAQDTFVYQHRTVLVPTGLRLALPPDLDAYVFGGKAALINGLYIPLQKVVNKTPLTVAVRSLDPVEREYQTYGHFGRRLAVQDLLCHLMFNARQAWHMKPLASKPLIDKKCGNGI